MNVVEKVAEAIAEIPGKPSTLEIARIAIEAYQEAIWSPTFDISNRAGMVPEFRRARAQQTTAHIMSIVGKYLCDHGEARGHRDASRELMEALYEAGAEVITDHDRATAGLAPRGPYGLTAEELRIRENRLLEVMRQPMPMFALNQQSTSE